MKNKNYNQLHQAIMLAATLALAISIVIYSFVSKKNFNKNKYEDIVQVILVISAIAVYLYTQFLHKKCIRYLIQNKTIHITDKKTVFFKTAYKQWILCSVIFYLSLLFFVIFCNLAFCFFSFMFLFIIALQAPSKQKMSIIFECKMEDL